MKKRFFALFLLFSLFIAGCQTGQEANADFNTFCMETFRSYSASDSLTLNYTLMSPKKYGITDLPDGFSSFSLHDLKQMQTSTEIHLQDSITLPKIIYPVKTDFSMIHLMPRLRCHRRTSACLLIRIRSTLRVGFRHSFRFFSVNLFLQTNRIMTSIFLY